MNNIFSLFKAHDSIKKAEKEIYKMCLISAAEHSHEPSRKFFATAINERFGTQNAEEIIEKYRTEVVLKPISESMRAMADFLKQYS